MGYREIGRTGKKAARDLIDGFDFSKAEDLSYLDLRFRAVVEPLHDWIFARNLLSIVLRIGGLYRTGADPRPSWSPPGFARSSRRITKDRFDMGPGACFAIPWHTTVLSHRYPLNCRRAPRYPKCLAPLRQPCRYREAVNIRSAIGHHLKGEGNGFVRFLTLLRRGSIDRKGRPEENRWCNLVVSSDIDSKPVKDQMQIANRLLQAIDGKALSAANRIFRREDDRDRLRAKTVTY